MTTPNGPARLPLRLSLCPPDAGGALDGGWWPQSRDLSVELRDLVDHFPRERGRLTRAIFSPPDWDEVPRRVTVRHGYVETTSVARDDTHVVVLRSSSRTDVVLLVIPHDWETERAEQALAAAATPRHATSAQALLEEFALP